jgi:hypothetical protein
MKIKEAKRVVDIIEASKDDDEVAHEMEDDLHCSFLRDIANGIDLEEARAVAEEILKTEEINFCRWCA